MQLSRSGAEVCDRAMSVPPMPDHLALSPSAWTLLDLLQQQLGVSLDVLDPSLRPLAPADVARPTSTVEDPAINAEALQALKTGEVRIGRSAAAAVGVFPLRIDREIVGLLLLSGRPARAETHEPVREASVEAAGHLVRTALESDLALERQLAETKHRVRRLHGVLRFLTQLGIDEDEPGLMNAVMQAATVWYDVDCRVYRRDADGAFTLAAMLPGAEQRPSATHLDRARAERLIAARRFQASGEADDLGIAGRRDELLVLPVGGTADPEWILLLSGDLDTEVDLTFSALAVLLAGVLQSREAARVESWYERLLAAAQDPQRAPERVLLELLEALAADMGATGGRISLVTGGEERALAALGLPSAPPGREAPGKVGAEPVDLTDTIGISADTSVRITVMGAREPSVWPLLRSWRTAIRPWIVEVAAGESRGAGGFEALVEASAFERRIQEEVERAKRFNLGLGLVLVGAGPGAEGEAALDALTPILRRELRASDLMGPVRSGLMALVLVHAESIGARSVVSRVRARLEMMAGEAPAGSVRLGEAVFSSECPSAEALIERALSLARTYEVGN